MLASLVDEVKADYIKVLKKLQVDGIVKPIPSSNVSLPEKQQEKPLTTVWVYFINLTFVYIFKLCLTLVD